MSTRRAVLAGVVVLTAGACAVPGVSGDRFLDIDTYLRERFSPYTVRCVAVDEVTGETLVDDVQPVAKGDFSRHLRYPAGHIVKVTVTLTAATPVTDSTGYIRFTDGPTVRSFPTGGQQATVAVFNTKR